MYHYYVRYSIFSKGVKIGDASIEIVIKKKITKYKMIHEIINFLIEEVKKNYSSVDNVIIDFYQLLRRSFR